MSSLQSHVHLISKISKYIGWQKVYPCNPRILIKQVAPPHTHLHCQLDRRDLPSSPRLSSSSWNLQPSYSIPSWQSRASGSMRTHGVFWSQMSLVLSLCKLPDRLLLTGCRSDVD